MSQHDESVARRLVEALERWRTEDAIMPASRSGLNASCLIEVGRTSVFVRIVDGAPIAVDTETKLMRSWDFAIRASAEVWEAHWQAIPAAGDHDIFALAKSKRLTVEGNLQPLMAHLFFFKALLAAPRDD
jgi:hypothetical protein